MDRIIKSISEIESESVKIMDDANAKKSEIFAQIQRETEEFDKEAEEKTDQRIAELRARLEKTMNEKLDRQSEEADEALTLLKQHYENEHGKYVDRLFREMTGA